MPPGAPGATRRAAGPPATLSAAAGALLLAGLGLPPLAAATSSAGPEPAGPPLLPAQAAPPADTGRDGAGAPADAPPLAACGLPQRADQVLAQLNAIRAQGAACGQRGAQPPAPPLAWHAQLQHASRTHAAHLAAHDQMAHAGADGRGPAERALDAGYRWRLLAENLAAGHLTLDHVLQAWMASDGHCANLMRPAMTHAALSCAASTGGTQPTYWVLKLGAPR
jgi:uncharacterized protein YkwD